MKSTITEIISSNGASLQIILTVFNCISVALVSIVTLKGLLNSRDKTLKSLLFQREQAKENPLLIAFLDNEIEKCNYKIATGLRMNEKSDKLVKLYLGMSEFVSYKEFMSLEPYINFNKELRLKREYIISHKFIQWMLIILFLIAYTFFIGILIYKYLGNSVSLSKYLPVVAFAIISTFLLIKHSTIIGKIRKYEKGRKEIMSGENEVDVI